MQNGVSELPTSAAAEPAGCPGGRRRAGGHHPGGQDRGSRPLAIAAIVAASLPGLMHPCRAAEGRLEEAASLRAAGRLDEALDVLRTESREIKRVEGEDAIRLLAVNDLAAEILVDLGSLETADSLLAKTIAAREKLIAAGRREQATGLGGSLLTRARLEAAARRLPDAAAAARRALLVLAAAPEPDEAAVARARQALRDSVGSLDELLGPAAEATRLAREETAAAFASLGMFSDAIEQRRRILAGLLAAPGANPAEILAATERLGRLMGAAGYAAEAIPLVEKSLASLPAAAAEESMAVRRLLGELQLAAGRLVPAGESFGQVLEATQAASKPSPVILAGDRLRSLLVALRRGRVEGLPEWFEPALRTLEKPSQTDLPQAISGLAVAAQVQQSLGDPAAAGRRLSTAQTLASSMRVADPATAAEIAGRLAAAQVAAGDFRAARVTAEKALPAAERELGPGAAATNGLRIVLADACSRDGRHAEAVALAEKALAYPPPRPNEDWERLATAAYDRLAGADEESGENGLRERYLAARADQFGERHPHVSAAAGLFGAARLAAGDWNRAVDLFSRSLAVARAGLGGEHPDVAAGLVLLAHAQRAAGDPERAVATAEQGLAAWERIAGPDHPGTLSAAEVLVAARMQAGQRTGVAELLERLSAADSIQDSSRKAVHLVRLADLTVGRDKPRATALLQEAMQLPCWQGEADLDPADRRRLAFTAALAAHAFTRLADPAAATDALRRGRGLAMQAENPKPLLDRVERLATQGDQPDGRR